MCRPQLRSAVDTGVHERQSALRETSPTDSSSMAQLVEACARLEPQYLEQRDQVICEPEVVTFGAPVFIVPEYERDREPVPPSEGEPD